MGAASNRSRSSIRRKYTMQQESRGPLRGASEGAIGSQVESKGNDLEGSDNVKG